MTAGSTKGNVACAGTSAKTVRRWLPTMLETTACEPRLVPRCPALAGNGSTVPANDWQTRPNFISRTSKNPAFT